MEFPVIPKRDASVSASLFRNCNARVPRKKLEVESTLIQPYGDEFAFAHHAALTEYNGKIYAMWSSGRVHEDDCGQRVLWSYTDGFSDWKEPMMFADTEMGVHSHFVKFAGGFCATKDRLYAYFTVSEYNPKYMPGEDMRPADIDVWTVEDSFLSVQRYVRYLLDDGVSWSEPQKVDFGGGNHSAERIANGRYIIPMSTGICYTDEIKADALPEYRYGGISDEQIKKAVSMGAPALCEPSLYQTDDGILHLVMRSGEHRLWYAESYDNGETFTDVYPTAFTDDLAKFQFGRLPDGRYYYVGNPVVGQGRLPLMLFTSEDGYNFDKKYIICDEPYARHKNGLGKGGHYGYPECAIFGGYMYVIYSKQKEVIEITRFSLEQID